ncbi:hypothetical protein V8B97DRAFT_1865001 [Scleroderma yunnanense]
MAAYSGMSYPRVLRRDTRFDVDDHEQSLDDYDYVPPVRRDRYSRRPSQVRRARDVAVTWLSASSGTPNTISRRNSQSSTQPNFSQPNLSNLSQPNLFQPNSAAPTTMTTSSTPRTRHAMPQPDPYDPPHPPQPIDMPTPVIGRARTPGTPAIGEHMAIPSEYEEEEDNPDAMPYVPYRKPPSPKKRFVGGFFKTLKAFPRFGRWRPNRRPPHGIIQAPSSIPEIHLEEEPDSADEDEPPMPQPRPGFRPQSEPDLESDSRPGSMPVPSVVSPRMPQPDRVDRARMPEPTVPYPVTQLYSSNVPSVATPIMPSGVIPIERSPPDRRHAPTPAALRHALSMDDEMDDDDRRSLEDEGSYMSYVPPPRTSTPVHHHHLPPRSSTPVHVPRPSHPQPPSEASFGPVIPPVIHVTSPTQSSSHTHSPPRTHAHAQHIQAYVQPQFYDPSSRIHPPQNSTFLSHITRFKRFIQELDQLPFSSNAQISDEYIPSETNRSRLREQLRGTTIPPSWYDMYDHGHHHHHHGHGIGPRAAIGTGIPGYGAVPMLDSMPPPLHQPTWGEGWDWWAAQSAARLRDVGPTHPPPLPPGVPGGAPGMAELHPGLGLTFPHGYAPTGGQPVFVYPSTAGHPFMAPGMW